MRTLSWRPLRHRFPQAADFKLRAVLAMVNVIVATLVHRGARNWNLGGVHNPDGSRKVRGHRNGNIHQGRHDQHVV